MGIREALESDIPQMQRVRASVHENTLPDYSVLGIDQYLAHLHEIGRGWVYERAGRIVGIAIANREKASIWALFVEPECEGQGIGRALHDTMLAWLRAQGVDRVRLGTAPRTRASRFYEAAGWVLRGTDRDGESVYEKVLS